MAVNKIQKGMIKIALTLETRCRPIIKRVVDSFEPRNYSNQISLKTRACNALPPLSISLGKMMGIYFNLALQIKLFGVNTDCNL